MRTAYAREDFTTIERVRATDRESHYGSRLQPVGAWMRTRVVIANHQPIQAPRRASAAGRRAGHRDHRRGREWARGDPCWWKSGASAPRKPVKKGETCCDSRHRLSSGPGSFGPLLFLRRLCRRSEAKCDKRFEKLPQGASSRVSHRSRRF